MIRRVFLFVVAAIFVLLLLNLNVVRCVDADVNAGAGEVCLQCLCNVVSNCNLTYGCNNEEQCGPFRITEPFWQDAGTPILSLDSPERSGAFTRCAVDPTCSAKAVSNYVTIYSKDCNRDGRVDCVDYAHLHQFGQGSSCEKNLASNFLQKLTNCLNQSVRG